MHRGFYGGALAAYPFIVTYLEKFYSGQKLLITGHSLGGAVALILSEMLRRNLEFSPQIVLYTYGAPALVTPRSSKAPKHWPTTASSIRTTRFRAFPPHG